MSYFCNSSLLKTVKTQNFKLGIQIPTPRCSLYWLCDCTHYMSNKHILCGLSPSCRLTGDDWMKLVRISIDPDLLLSADLPKLHPAWQAMGVPPPLGALRGFPGGTQAARYGPCWHLQGKSVLTGATLFYPIIYHMRGRHTGSWLCRRCSVQDSNLRCRRGHKEDCNDNGPPKQQCGGSVTTLAHLPYRCSTSLAKQHRLDAGLAQPWLWMMLHPTRGCASPISVHPFWHLICWSCILNLVLIVSTK